MEDFLTAVSTRKVQYSEPLIEQIGGSDIRSVILVDSAQAALKALKDKPDRTTVNNVLNYLSKGEVSLALPEPMTASIAHQLINDTIPNYWRALKESPQAELLTKALRNPTGLGHIMTRLRSLIVDSHQKKAPGGPRNTLEHVEDMIDVLDRTLQGHQTSCLVLQEILKYSNTTTQKKLIWKEYISQVASGRLLSLAAEAENILERNDILRAVSWVSDGTTFAKWIGYNILGLVEADDDLDEYVKAVVEFCSRALGLGYNGKERLIWR